MIFPFGNPWASRNFQVPSLHITGQHFQAQIDPLLWNRPPTQPSHPHLDLLAFPLSATMSILLYTADILVLLSFTLALRVIRDYQRRRGLPYPPGPRPLPVIGNLLHIPKEFSWLTYTQFSEKYGINYPFTPALLAYNRIHRRCYFLPRFRTSDCCAELHQVG